MALALHPAMTVFSYQNHTTIASPGPPARESSAVTAAKLGANEAKGGEQKESFFQHLLDVVNPLQHLPIIGTIYRAITGERLDPVEKIAGGALYGGLWGAVGSIADVAFEGITGKSFEDTALALFKSDSPSNSSLAKANRPVPIPAAVQPSPARAAANIPDSRDVAALTDALSAKGVDTDIANRALYAYRRSMGHGMPPPVFASLH
ncbi:MAG TPA: hypothetical protein VJ750_08500 [Rhizomicrobium sp.]|nr:hypothetical protein [Rhizomicrobium sp.]